MVTLLCGAGGAVFAFLDAGLYVAMIASLSASMLHWANYVNMTTKIRRYNNTIEGLKSLGTHWHSLDGLFVPRGFMFHVGLMLSVSSSSAYM